MSNGWIAMHRGESIDTLQKEHPDSFLLLCQIARRARREPCTIKGLEVGEAQIGDYENAGIATMRKYRTAKTNLTKFGISTFRTTNKGTIAKLMDARFFSNSRETRDKPDDKHATSDRQAGDKHSTTNKKVRKEEGKNERSNTPQPPRGEWSPDATQTKLNQCFNRRESTKWSDAEIRLYKKIDFNESDVNLIASYSDSETGCKFRRKDLKTLLNNWHGELDRARAWQTTTNGAPKKFQSGHIEIAGRKGYIHTRAEIDKYYGDKADELPLQHEQ